MFFVVKSKNCAVKCVLCNNSDFVIRKEITRFLRIGGSAYTNMFLLSVQIGKWKQKVFTKNFLSELTSRLEYTLLRSINAPRLYYDRPKVKNTPRSSHWWVYKEKKRWFLRRDTSVDFHLPTMPCNASAARTVTKLKRRLVICFYTTYNNLGLGRNAVRYCPRLEFLLDEKGWGGQIDRY